MARSALSVIGCSLLLVGGAAIVKAATTADSWTTFSGRVVGVTDGDTITVLRGEQPIRVRLEGIDCPERGQDFGTRAKQATSELVFGKTVRVDVRDVDRYGRAVGRVYAGETDVSLTLVESGLAWHYTKYSSEAALAEAERRARAEGRGLWSRADAVPPWEFRRGGARAAGARASEGPFHGNTSSGVFHGPWCQHYDCQNCTATFATREEAIAAGYRPGGGCKP